MNVREKLKRYTALVEKAEKLRNEIAENNQKKMEIEMQLAGCQSRLNALNKATRKKWLDYYLPVLCIVLVVYLVSGMVGVVELPDIDLATSWSTIAAVIIFLIIFIIYRLGRSAKARKIGNGGELTAQIARLQSELEPFSAAEKELEELEDELEYSGEEWDMRGFDGTAEEIAEMEEDFVDLLIVLKHRPDDTDFIANSWISLNELQATNASWAGDQALEAEYRKGFEVVRDSGSWVLKLWNAANASLIVELLKIQMRGDGEGLPYEEALKRVDVRPPENEEEQALWDLAQEVLPNVVFKVCYELRKMTGRL